VRLALKASLALWGALVQVALALVGTGFGAVVIGLPGPAGEAPLAVLVALLATLLIAPSIVYTWPKDRTVPSRSSGVIALLIVLTQLGPALAIAVVSGMNAGSSGVSYAGILLWLLALQLAAGVMLSARFQGLAPAVYVFVCALVGRSGSVVQPWAWPLAGIDPATALLIGGIAFGVAGTLLASIGLHRSEQSFDE